MQQGKASQRTTIVHLLWASDGFKSQETPPASREPIAFAKIFLETLNANTSEDRSAILRRLVTAASVPQALKAQDAWEETAHPRGAEGSSKGGQFVKKGEGGGSASESSGHVAASSSGVSKASESPLPPLVKKPKTTPPSPPEPSHFAVGTEARAIEDRFRKKLYEDWDGAKEQYAKKFGKKLLSVDDARELSDDYDKDRSLAYDVQESQLPNLSKRYILIG